MMFRKVLLLVFLSACLVSGRVNAAVFIFDDFDDGDIGANNSGEGSGFETTANAGGSVEENDGQVSILGGTSGANRTQIGSKESFSASDSTVFGVFIITDMFRSQSVDGGTARFYAGFSASLPNGQGPIQGQTDGLWILLHGRYTFAGVDTWGDTDGGLIYNSGGTITTLANWTWDPSVFDFDTASGLRSDRMAMDMVAPDLTCVLSSDAAGYSLTISSSDGSVVLPEPVMGTWADAGVSNNLSEAYASVWIQGADGSSEQAIVLDLIVVNDTGWSQFPVARSPEPGDEVIDVPREVVLSWAPGALADTHNVYLGTNLDDVSNAVMADAVSQGQDVTSYDAGRLDFGQTYYWRVDEVNGAPDFAVLKGDIWSFTTEPFSVPLTPIAATASGSFGVSVAENTINGSGLEDDLHGVSAPDMWISAGIPATIEYAFDRAYKLHELWVWNSNQTIEPFIGFGVKDVVIEHSLDGENWSVLEGVAQLAQAPGAEGYAHNNTIGFGGVAAQHVRIVINSVHGFAPQASLSEVRFFSIPVLAREPNPVSGATNVAPDLLLSWRRNGREAGRHEVYVGIDSNNLPLAGSVSESSFDTAALDLQLGETYSWRVDEVNETADPSTWTGDIWSFTTVDKLIVDDMESYRDEEFFEIWATWIDGFDDPANNGAVVGAIPSLGDFSPETTIFNGGRQSLPIHFDNSGAPRSEATRTFAAAQDWNKHGVQGLVLFFHGSLANTGGRLYLKINDTQFVYDGDQSDLQRIGFHKWYIDLTALTAATRGAVNSLTVGIDSGGAGVIYIDDMLLTPETRELITPAELGPEGLVVYYPFDGDFQDASGNGRHGIGMGGALGGPLFGSGQSGQAILLDGAGQYVEITGYKGISAVDGVQQPFSISNWFTTTGDGEMVTWGSSPGGQRLSWRIDLGSLRAEHGNGNLRGNTLVNDGEWHHAALVVQEGANLRVPNTTLYIDGLADGVNAGDDALYNLTPGEDVSIGRRATSNDRFFPGSIDEVRIFDRTLSAGEVAGLAGRTQAFDKP